MAVAIRCTDIVVRYGKALALQGVSLEVEQGRVHAIVGPNGAGKSTLVNALLGAVRSSGQIELAGEDVTRLSTAQRGKRGLAAVGQGRPVFPHLSVLENLRVMAGVLDLDDAAVDAALDRFPVLRSRVRLAVGALSGGEQQMLVVARALMAEPSVLLLDEAGTGLAPWVVDEVFSLARELASNGVTVIVSEPTIGRVVDVADEGCVLIRGAIVARASSPEQLAQQFEQQMGLISQTIDAAPAALLS
ncbi:MAG: ABC transporter ATP-binding protein [Acidimicrobiia bacterium]